MTKNPDKIARAEAVGSLLQPARVLEARDAARAGSISAAELHAIEDEAVLVRSRCRSRSASTSSPMASFDDRVGR
jgi:hypothetical protein